MPFDISQHYWAIEKGGSTMFLAGFITGAIAMAVVAVADLPWYGTIIVGLVVNVTGRAIAKLILD